MIVNTLATNYPALVNTLAEYVQKRRAELGLTQKELAEKSGLSRDFIAQVESQKSKLPQPDNRRKLAKGLGVSHIDILIAAGELLAEDVEQSGVQGVIERDPNNAKQKLIAYIHDAPLTDWAVDTVILMIQRLVAGPRTPSPDPERSRTSPSLHP